MADVSGYRLWAQRTGQNGSSSFNFSATNGDVSYRVEADHEGAFAYRAAKLNKASLLLLSREEAARLEDLYARGLLRPSPIGGARGAVDGLDGSDPKVVFKAAVKKMQEAGFPKEHPLSVIAVSL